MIRPSGRRRRAATPVAHDAAGAFAGLRALAAILAVAVAGCGPAAPPAPAASVVVTGSAERGQGIAQAWCASCHRIEPRQRRVARPAEGAPSFQDIAQRWGDRPDALRHFMDDLHLPMPTFRLWPQERDDVVAYIASLDRAPRP
ncbi:MAG: cytochrome c [Alphaproteobacteria bacterium]|nr:cytochrome c [Alphaproteobacteria bacterium]